MLNQVLTDYLNDIHAKGLYREKQATFLGGERLDFSSNDYLSLRSDPRIKKAYSRGVEKHPVGSGGSMVICGYHPAHKELEQAFKDALNVDACLLFSSGYVANLSVLGLLGQVKTGIFLDKKMHASIYDGLVLSQATFQRYRHNDLADLTLKLDQTQAHGVILTEGIFSMSGQQAPLNQLVALGQQYQKEVIVDEAHSFGLLGRKGLGAVVGSGLGQDDVPLRIIPFGKAFAGCGAVVVGKAIWVDALQQAARPHIYSTGMSPAIAYGLMKTLEIISLADDRRQHLFEMVGYFKSQIANSSLTWAASDSPIQQLHLGCPLLAQSVSKKLWEKGIQCVAIRQPTVNKKETGLRIVLNYAHQRADIDYLFESLHH